MIRRKLHQGCTEDNAKATSSNESGAGSLATKSSDEYHGKGPSEAAVEAKRINDFIKHRNAERNAKHKSSTDQEPQGTCDDAEMSLLDEQTSDWTETLKNHGISQHRPSGAAARGAASAARKAASTAARKAGGRFLSHAEFSELKQQIARLEVEKKRLREQLYNVKQEIELHAQVQGYVSRRSRQWPTMECSMSSLSRHLRSSGLLRSSFSRQTAQGIEAQSDIAKASQIHINKLSDHSPFALRRSRGSLSKNS